ncbi:MAG: glycerophosphodiester phosphodiesterase [Nocardioidaceae bacterium]
MSAHSCGAGARARPSDIGPALRRAVSLGCEYVEFDVQLTGDGTLVLLHDQEVELAGRRCSVATLTPAQIRSVTGSLTTYDDALAVLAGQKKAHIDLKFVTGRRQAGGQPPEVRAARRAVEVLGAENVVLTTPHEHMVAAIRAWSAERHPDLLVGLTVGGRRPGRRWWQAALDQVAQLLPASRVRAADANLVAAHRLPARLTVARWAARAGLPLLVWTVDDRRGLSRWLTDRRVWVVTTNLPQLAVQIRADATGND